MTNTQIKKRYETIIAIGLLGVLVLSLVLIQDYKYITGHINWSISEIIVFNVFSFLVACVSLSIAFLLHRDEKRKKIKDKYKRSMNLYLGSYTKKQQSKDEGSKQCP